MTGHASARCGKQLRDRLNAEECFRDAIAASWRRIAGRWYCRYCRFAGKVTIVDAAGNERRLFDPEAVG